jgi:hypothetical protein
MRRWGDAATALQMKMQAEKEEENIAAAKRRRLQRSSDARTPTCMRCAYRTAHIRMSR